LSSNRINNIDEDAFAGLDVLKMLDLSNNNIRSVSIKLSDSVQLLTMAHNHLVTWPLASAPESLAELELQENQLARIFPKDRQLNNLRVLNIGSNIIDHLPNTIFPQLSSLDISYNQLTTVPQNLNDMAPLLSDLILDGNPISSVEFTEKTTLGTISLSNMLELEKLDARAFTNLQGTNVNGEATCVDVKISNNPKLRDIHEAAFEGLTLCRLDLSFNQLMKIPENLTDWTSITEGIDLQGNPWSCFCEDQWMLDTILALIYNSDHQYLLHDLKCQYPESLNNTRFVQFWQHDNAFCDPNNEQKLDKIVQKSSFGDMFSPSNPDNKVQFELTHGPGFIIVICLCAIVLVAMIAVGIHWQREQNRKLARRNRLYMFDDY